MNNTNDIISILVLTVIVLIIAFWFIWFLATIILNLISTHHFYVAAYRSLDGKNVDKRTQSIRNDYEVYCRRRYGAGWKDIISLCQELASKLKSKKTFQGYTIAKYSIEELEEVIEVLKEDNIFNDEKMNNVVDEISRKTNEEYARTVREYIIRLRAYCQGQLFEKESEKRYYIDRMERKKWFNRFCSIIGIVGSIASIYSVFR